MQTKKMLCLQLVMQSYFCWKKITRADYIIFCSQRVRIFPIQTFYIDFQKCFLHAFIHWEFMTIWGFLNTLLKVTITTGMIITYRMIIGLWPEKLVVEIMILLRNVIYTVVYTLINLMLKARDYCSDNLKSFQRIV